MIYTPCYIVLLFLRLISCNSCTVISRSVIEAFVRNLLLFVVLICSSNNVVRRSTLLLKLFISTKACFNVKVFIIATPMLFVNYSIAYAYYLSITLVYYTWLSQLLFYYY